MVYMLSMDYRNWEREEDMRIENTWNSNYQMNAPSKATKTDTNTGQQFVSPKEQDQMAEKSTRQLRQVSSLFGGMSFEELIQSGKGRVGQIPKITHIVQAKNPNDEIYHTVYVSEDNKIMCNSCLDGRVWELNISEKDKEKVNDFFKDFIPDPLAPELYFEDDNDMRMGMATVKDFWVELFKK